MLDGFYPVPAAGMRPPSDPGRSGRYRSGVDHAAALVEQNRLLVEIVRDADPATPVSTCPGWTLRQLAVHVGRGDRWAAAMVRDRADSVLDMHAVPDGAPPADAGPAADWLDAGPRLLADAISSTGPDTPVWTFTGPQPALWWVRRRLHESVVHRADAALAVGLPFAVDPEVAADGVSERLMLLAARPAARGPAPLDAGTTMHLHATDDGLGEVGEWMVHGSGSGISWEHGHGKGTVAVRGRAADLLLADMRRIPADDRIQVLGDASVWRTWRDRAIF